jgi:hypothetical protein
MLFFAGGWSSNGLLQNESHPIIKPWHEHFSIILSAPLSQIATKEKSIWLLAL